MDLQILQWLVQMKVNLTSDSILIRLVALKEFHTSVWILSCALLRGKLLPLLGNSSASRLDKLMQISKTLNKRIIKIVLMKKTLTLLISTLTNQRARLITYVTIKQSLNANITPVSTPRSRTQLAPSGHRYWKLLVEFGSLKILLILTAWQRRLVLQH
jgi:hypothetical protein